MSLNKSIEVISRALTTGLLELWKSGCLTDITICIENKKFECHKVVLAAVSPYFKAMFLSDFKEKEKSEIHIQDVKAEAFNVILQLIYAEGVAIDQQNIECILSAASMLQIDCVISRCEEFLVENLTPDTCIFSWRISSLYAIPAVTEKAFRFILESFRELSEHESFLELSKDEIIKVISSNELNVHAEEEVSDAVLKWMKKDNMKRKEVLFEILEHVRIPLLRPRYIRKLIKSDSVFETDINIVRLLNAGISVHAMLEFRLTSSKRNSFHRSHMPLQDVCVAGTLSDGLSKKFLLFDFNREEIIYSLDFEMDISDMLYTNNNIYILGNAPFGKMKLCTLSLEAETLHLRAIEESPGASITFADSAFMIPIDKGIYFFARTTGKTSLGVRYDFDDRILTLDMSISSLKNVHAAIISCSIYLFFNHNEERNCIAHFIPSEIRCGLAGQECGCRLDTLGHLEHDSNISKVLVEDDDIYVLFEDGRIWKLCENERENLSQRYLFQLNNFDSSNISATLHLGKLFMFAAGEKVKVVDIKSGKQSVMSDVEVPENFSCKFSNKAAFHRRLIETHIESD